MSVEYSGTGAVVWSQYTRNAMVTREKDGNARMVVINIKKKMAA